VRTQAEHFRLLIPLIAEQHTVYALDLPGMGYSEIMPGASYDEPAIHAGVERLYGEKDWSRPSDRQANKKLLPAADFTQVPKAGHFIDLERPDVQADLLNAVA
jgi:pimeloyl-ACP methyl ester carboxylesterase